jgi:dephospho-CoA kinase
LQVQRLKARSPELSDQDIENFLSAQIPIDEKRKSVDFVFDNSASLSEAERVREMKTFWKKITEV